MKRSEMIEKLNYLIGSHYSSATHSDPKDAVSAILQGLEEAGMKPPTHYPYTCFCSMRGSCPNCNPNEYKMYSVWEAEDETK